MTLKEYEKYVYFLETRLGSERYKASVSEEGYRKTQEEYEKAKQHLEGISSAFQ